MFDLVCLAPGQLSNNLIQLEASYKITTIGLDTYLKNTDDALFELVQEHDGRKKLYSIQEQFKQELDLTIPDKQAEETTTKYAKRTKQMARNKTQEKLTKQWENKALHGRFPKRIKEADVDHHKTNQWLKSSGLKAETGRIHSRSPRPKPSYQIIPRQHYQRRY